MLYNKKILKTVAEQFLVVGTWQDAIPYGHGHINDTYLVKWRVKQTTSHTILQRINHLIFKNPPQLMDNILRISAHLQAKLNNPAGANSNRQALTIIRTRDKQLYHQDAENNYWRMYNFIDDAKTIEVCTCSDQAYEAAKAFGEFQALLTDLPGQRLHETILYFHHTPRRLQALQQAVQSDPHNRGALARAEIDFCLAREELANQLTRLIESGRMPERITHNDTKINNIMIDNCSGQGICVIDLDTVMSGCALYDFGDMVRSMPRTAAEDERDLSKVALNLEFFEALTRGYLETAGAFLTPLELEYLLPAGQVIIFTIGIRFLTDYLLGDVYFKTQRPQHNLERARVQFKMIESIQQQEAVLRAILRKYT